MLGSKLIYISTLFSEPVSQIMSLKSSYSGTSVVKAVIRRSWVRVPSGVSHITLIIGKAVTLFRMEVPRVYLWFFDIFQLKY